MKYIIFFIISNLMITVISCAINPGTKPTAIILSSPSDGTAVPDRTPVLEWEENPDAASYHLIVADNSDFSNPIIDNDQIETIHYTVSGRYPELLLVDYTYYWKVAGINKNAHRGDFSETWSFHVEYANKLTHGPMAAAVTPDSAKIWVRTSEASAVQVGYQPLSASPEDTEYSGINTTGSADDFTTAIDLINLAPDTTYVYSIIIDSMDVTPAIQPQFKTFPDSTTEVTIGLITDMRIKDEIPVNHFNSLKQESPDFVIELGDWDHSTPHTLKGMRIMHQYTRGPTTYTGSLFQDLILSYFPMVHTWDDHDYGKNNGDKTFARKADTLKASDEYWPTYDRPNYSNGLWHSFIYGNLVEVFVLDLRSQRDRNSYNDPRFIPDDQIDSNRDEIRDDPERSMLDGDDLPENLPKGQKTWFKEGLLASTTPWKLVVSSVPWNRTCVKDDTWWDFRAEQNELMDFINTNNIRGIIVSSGDIHIGGAIDNGSNGGLPELNVPTINITLPTSTCSVHNYETAESSYSGTWSHGIIEDGTGYGLLRFTTTTARIIAKDKYGTTVLKYICNLLL